MYTSSPTPRIQPLQLLERVFYYTVYTYIHYVYNIHLTSLLHYYTTTLHSQSGTGAGRTEESFLSSEVVQS
jgi:hypothetical protein